MRNLLLNNAWIAFMAAGTGIIHAGMLGMPRAFFTGGRQVCTAAIMATKTARSAQTTSICQGNGGYFFNAFINRNQRLAAPAIIVCWGNEIGAILNKNTGQ